MILVYHTKIAENMEDKEARTIGVSCVGCEDVLKNILDVSKVLFIEVERLAVVVKGVLGILGSPDANAITSGAIWGAES